MKEKSYPLRTFPNGGSKLDRSPATFLGTSDHHLKAPLPTTTLVFSASHYCEVTQHLP